MLQRIPEAHQEAELYLDFSLKRCLMLAYEYVMLGVNITKCHKMQVKFSERNTHFLLGLGIREGRLSPRGKIGISFSVGNRNKDLFSFSNPPVPSF